MIQALLQLLESVSFIPGMQWMQKYAMQYRGATTQVRDRKQRAEELTGRVKTAGKAAKHAGGGGKAPQQRGGKGGGAKGDGGPRLRAARGPNSRKAAGPKSPSGGGRGGGGGGMGPSRPTAPRDTAGFDDGPGYEPPPRKDRLRRRARPDDDDE